MKILSINTDSKTRKGKAFGYLTGITYLAPANEAGVGNMCSHSSAGCRDSCLFTAGRGGMPSVVEARIAKTVFLVEDREAYLDQLIGEVRALVRKADKDGLTPCIRPNGTTDKPWEKMKRAGKSIMEMFPAVQFYDYTKNPNRAIAHAAGKMPSNYHLTFSRSEANDKDVARVMKVKGNVAVVFSGKLPKRYKGKRVVDGVRSRHG